MPESDDYFQQDDEEDWLRAAARNPAFQDLGDLEEDIYSLEDGLPFRDEEEAGRPGV